MVYIRIILGYVLEEMYGYCCVVKVGNIVYILGIMVCDEDLDFDIVG